MEPVSSGASVLAFVLMGIKSARLLHQALQAIRDGPRHVSQVATDVLRLQSVLKQLSRCHAASHDDDMVLKSQIRSCVGDLDDFARIVLALQVAPADKPHVVLWKSIKASLGENDLEKMRVVVANHISALSIRLNILQRYGSPDPALHVPRG